MINKKQKNFGEEIGNFIEIKANISYFWLIIKKILIIIMTINKAIIRIIIIKILQNIIETRKINKVIKLKQNKDLNKY